MASRYAVTLVGSWSSSVEATTAKEAAELLLRKNEPTLKDADFELVKDNVAPKVTVMLDKKTGRKVLNKYNIVIKGKKGAVKSVNSRVDSTSKKTLEAKMDLVTYFKNAKKKERERYAKYVEKTYGSSNEKMLEWCETDKANVKKMLKAGESPIACARAHFDKCCTDVEETIMSAENFKSEYKLFTDVELKNKANVLKALKSGVCMFLVRKSKGGVTAYMGTTSLQVHNALYEPNIFVLYKMADAYSDYLTMTSRKLTNIKNNFQMPAPKSETVKIASCSLRMKDEEEKGVPTGRFKVSSLEYTVALDNILCMVLFKNLPQVDKTVTSYLAQGFMMAGGSDVEFAKKFAFDREAFNFALRTYNEKKLPYQDLVNALERRAKESGFSDADISTYRSDRDTVISNQIKHLADAQASGLTDAYMYQRYGI